MTSFATNRLDLFSVSPGESGVSASLNTMLTLFDTSFNGVSVAEAWANDSNQPTVDSDDFGRAWVWNVSGSYSPSGNANDWAALDSEIGGFERGDLILYTPGGWIVVRPQDTVDNDQTIGDGVVIYVHGGEADTFDLNDAYGSSDSNNTLHIRNRIDGSNKDGFFVFDKRGRGDLSGGTDDTWGSEHGWTFLGGLEVNQPWGWTTYGDPETVDSALGSAHEVAVGWFDGALLRRFIWDRNSNDIDSTGTTKLSLKNSSHEISHTRALCSIRVILDSGDGDQSSGPPSIEVAPHGNGAFEVYLDRVNEELVLDIETVSNAFNVGDTPYNLDDWDRMRIILEYTADR